MELLVPAALVTANPVGGLSEAHTDHSYIVVCRVSGFLLVVSGTAAGHKACLHFDITSPCAHMYLLCQIHCAGFAQDTVTCLPALSRVCSRFLRIQYLPGTCVHCYLLLQLLTCTLQPAA
jgi:hypothetical protein